MRLISWGNMDFSYRRTVIILAFIIISSLIKLADFAIADHQPPAMLTAQEVRQDLFSLLSQIEQHSAFYALNPEQHWPQLTHWASLISSQSSDQMSRERFAAQITKLINVIKDPGVLVRDNLAEHGDLPFILRPLNEQWLALDSQHHPLDPRFPFVTHIDGLPLSKWIAASQAYLPESTKDSQEMQRPWLSKLQLLREDLGLSIKPFVLITLTNDALDTRQLELAIAPRHSMAAATKAKSSPSVELSVQGLLEQLVSLTPKSSAPESAKLETINSTTARLKLNDLYAFGTDPKLQQTLLMGMEQPLLVLDLRDASGFSPKLLTLLARYQDPQAPHSDAKRAEPMAHIMGFAHYRRSSTLRNDHLQPLSFMPLAQFSPRSRQANKLTDYLPPVDERQFSPWFIRTQPLVPPQGHNRLALLVSPRCRQECEWIAYKTKTWSRVQLIGEKTSGDFAKQYRFNLPNSDVEIRLSSALIYDANGKLLSGNGTEPDIGLPQNTDIEWQGLVSLVMAAKPKQPQQYQAAYTAAHVSQVATAN